MEPPEFSGDRRGGSETMRGSLVSVVVLLRHGDRAPYWSFPNDQYFDSSYWPMGHGQMTDKGKERMYQMGKWLRSRYSAFLPSEYSPSDIYVRATDVDRCLVSAATILAGLYPPQASTKTWNLKQAWQPIPIHTKPFFEDEVLGMKTECPKYDELFEELKDTEYYRNVSGAFKGFFQTVSTHTGWERVDLAEIKILHTVFEIYKSFNKCFLPSWYATLHEKTLTYLAGLAHAKFTHTTEMKRLVTGPFWATLFSYFDLVQDSTDIPKFMLFVSHDTTLVALLNSMDVFDDEPPAFGAALLWELRRTSEGAYYIEVGYKRTDGAEVETLVVPGCLEVCPYAHFKRILQEVTVDSDTWRKECEASRGNLGVFGFVRGVYRRFADFWWSKKADNKQKPFFTT
ncbi:hypothetical protein NQ318_021588 [Aromia moschata]|uniref:acid phosphatase n=1 Tax=Aromia moschata TaxID=1265417 RepID=A0AAV8YIA6_9CUCU|nr:hypothetical protein NQ318_021588 [Aromia moschata]